MVMAIWAPLNKFSQVPLDQNPPPPHLRHPVQWHHSELRRRETSGPALGWNWEPKKHQKRLTRRMKTMVRVLPRMFVLSRKESRKKTMVRVLARMFLLLRKESRMKIFWLKLCCISPKYPMDHWRKPKKKPTMSLKRPAGMIDKTSTDYAEGTHEAPMKCPAMSSPATHVSRSHLFCLKYFGSLFCARCLFMYISAIPKCMNYPWPR